MNKVAIQSLHHFSSVLSSYCVKFVYLQLTHRLSYYVFKVIKLDVHVTSVFTDSIKIISLTSLHK